MACEAAVNPKAAVTPTKEPMPLLQSRVVRSGDTGFSWLTVPFAAGYIACSAENTQSIA